MSRFNADACGGFIFMIVMLMIMGIMTSSPFFIWIPVCLLVIIGILMLYDFISKRKANRPAQKFDINGRNVLLDESGNIPKAKLEDIYHSEVLFSNNEDEGKISEYLVCLKCSSPLVFTTMYYKKENLELLHINSGSRGMWSWMDGMGCRSAQSAGDYWGGCPPKIQPQIRLQTSQSRCIAMPAKIRANMTNIM